MAWTGHFVDTSYRERAEFLYNFLQMWDICPTNTETAFFDTLKFIVGGIMLRKNPRYIVDDILKGRISHSIRYEKAGIKIKEID